MFLVEKEKAYVIFFLVNLFFTYSDKLKQHYLINIISFEFN